MLANGDKFKDRVYFNSNKKVSHWWNSECDQIMSGKKESFKKFISRPLLTNWQSHKDVCKRAKAKIRSIRVSSFRDFCNSLNVNLDSGRVWRALKSFKNVRSKHKTLISGEEKKKAAEALSDLCRPNPLLSSDSIGSSESVVFLPSGYTNPLPGMVDRSHPTPQMEDSDPSGTPLSDLESVELKYRNDTVIRPFTKGEFSCAIGSCKLRSAHGPDA